MQVTRQILIVEDDPAEMALAVAGLAPLQMDCLQARSAQQAAELIQRREAYPLIAVVDWDMSLAPDQLWSIPQLLRWLRDREPNLTVIVFSVYADQLTVTAAVQGADPSAYLHDKRHRIESLLERLRRMCTVRLADLTVQGACVVHIPSQARFKHPIGMSFLLADPEPVWLGPDGARSRAAHRFNEWLIEMDSSLRVGSFGKGSYKLIATTAATLPTRRKVLDRTKVRTDDSHELTRSRKHSGNSRAPCA
ncbi:MAG: response regulator [Candidatus Dormibacteria bacterium]